VNVVHIFPEDRLLFPGRKRRWFVRLVASNGETLAISQAYATKWNAKRAATKNYRGLDGRPLQIKEVAS
jgi:uncharacterized protein DUF1508